ncbi:MAG: thioredoxin-disulfide reductase [Sulfurimonas sp. RIFOXYD12_FULL_33_39]|uniref:thioredoxin-disulfide reductase n=1 Tax=unclassified Sulfurimonas TaxID=2623549 RepID=UPI0008B2747A|nr:MULTISPECIES: thioredoxin-disulfide reductase [unclassified Sulfurimonas]OHE05939.1 MAG: thioredoxin-disulfide reductase [Sulfurimonas sp. RIFCSPLOWO2_12_FULL_34_6]OHE09950.1 MAG: thioredoxin-disulfide reductase [Sulfurimonas sp. RIFOXYD12_FULL_33_39]OHE13929.1 MAG: thioredoxin-disulfide reductase [Sulfurimonas sp. RIFOXYD2_FULL_34_21]
MLDCAIIGGGPAGLTAGLYTTRGGLENVVMFEKGMPGGQITLSSEIENYPGVSGEISGMDLMMPWPAQCQKFGLKHEMVEVKRVSKDGNIFKIHKEDGSVSQAHSVIICTGSSPRRAGFAGEDELFGKGVSTCATCDGFFYKGKEVAVIGGGDTALEEALYLAKICSKVYLVHRRDTFRSAPNTVKRIKNTQNIELVLNSTPEEVYGDNMGVTGLHVKTGNGEIRDIKVLGVFVFVGNDVNNQTLIQEDGSFLCDVNKNGEVIVDIKMKTSLKGLYAAGDMRLSAPKQVVSAAGDGAVAALEAITYVDEKLNS